MRHVFWATSIGLAVLGCAAKSQPPAPVAQSASDRTSDSKPIVHIVSRSQTITVSSSSTGLRYSLKDASGNLMIADASEKQFAELQPELFRNIKSYIAVHADDAPVIPADRREADAIPWSGLGSPVPAALKANMRGGVTSGASRDPFIRTSEHRFPTAREDAPQ